MTEVHVDFFSRGSILVAAIDGELDFSNIEDVGAQIRENMTNDRTGLVVDLTLARYIDSGGVRMLFGFVEQVEACRQGFGIVLPETSPVRRLVEVTNLDSVAVVCTTVEECVAGLERNSRDRI